MNACKRESGEGRGQQGGPGESKERVTQPQELLFMIFKLRET